MQQSTATALNVACVATSSLLDRVLAYKNAEFIERLKDKLSITHEEAEVLFVDMKQFLYLCGTRHGKWSPPSQIDAAWHEFVLYTKDYKAFCNKMFGRFIHHVPRSYFDAGLKGRTWATLQVARELFRELSNNWDVPESMRPRSANDVEGQSDDVNPCDSCGCSPCGT